ncbi:MAG: M23 family metallopeptidase [Gaiellaceae bacterium]
MSATSHIQRGALVVAATAATFAFGVAAPARASYGWPLKPFHQQHPVRAFFGDPRIAGNDEAHGTFHFGIDISAPNGTPVYATLDGVASIHPLHHDTVIVSAGGGVAHEYWHVVPAIVPGQRVVAYKTVVGHVEAPWRHVHFSEAVDYRYVNPLRPGALEPYRDTRAPSVRRIFFEHDGVAAGDRLSGTVDLVAEACDFPSLQPPGPWRDAPLVPTRVEWKLVGRRGVRAAASSGWHAAADFRTFLPTVPFASVYARWTRQNHPDLNHRLGRYRFVLARAFETRLLPNGAYRLVVRALDTRGNVGVSSRAFTVENGM